MRATEILRNLLDIIDSLEAEHPAQAAEIVTPLGVANNTEDERRLSQIADLLPSDDEKLYTNSPRERVASINAVTIVAGDGVNGPKHPSDLRADSVSMYPNFQGKK